MSDGGILTFFVPHLIETIIPSVPPGHGLWTLPGWESEVEEMVQRPGGRPVGGQRRGD